MVDQLRMAGLQWEQRHHDMQNMAKMMMTFVKIGVMKLKNWACIYEYTRE
jgi:hypothetical protein